MLWLKLGWRNLWRNRRRTIIELSSIAGSIFLGLTWNNLAIGTYDKMINDGVRMVSGHIGIYNDQYLDLRKTDEVVDADTLVPELEQVPGVTAVYPRLYVPGLVRSSRESRATVIMGMDIPRERPDNPMLAEKRIVEGEIPSPDNTNGALIGWELARELDLTVGNKFVVMAQSADGDIKSALLRISGIIRSNINEIDAGSVIVDRSMLADMAGYPGMAHEIGVMLVDHRMIPAAMDTISAIAAGSPPAKAYRWEQAMPDLSSAVQMDHVGLQIMVALLYVLVGIGTINTMLMSVMERTREFGVIRAIGLNRAGIRKMVLVEATVLGMVGVAIGTTLSLLVGLYTSTHGVDFSAFMTEQSMGRTLVEPIMYSRWDIGGMVTMCGGMLVLAILASLYPAHYITRTGPTEAMRQY